MARSYNASIEVARPFATPSSAEQPFQFLRQSRLSG